jgi:Ca2+-transporting ATPase
VADRDASWHALTLDVVQARLAADLVAGLTSEECSRRLEEHGRNELPRPPKEPEWKKLLAQLKDPLVGLLLVAAVVATVVNLSTGGEGESLLQRMGDAIAILIIVVLNAVLGYLQERRAERALDALEKMTSPTANVLRDGGVVTVDAALLVPGDVVILDTGDRAPADLRLVESANLAVDEAALTGESLPVEKSAGAVVAPDTPVADRVNMAFLGCTVVRGRGRGIVSGTGVNSRLGRIGQLIGEAEQKKTPLEERLERFGRGILIVTLAVSALVFVAGLWGGGGSLATLFLVAVSLAVAVIPEGLPAISTITLALGMQRMAKHGALVRRLPAVETLGCATVICSDKTGTLTCNEMTVREVRLPRGRRFTATGEGWDPAGEILRDGAAVDALADLGLLPAIHCGVFCSNSRLAHDGDAWSVVGDPTEGALLTLAAKAGLADLVVTCGGDRRVSEVPFAADRRRMSVVTVEDDGARVLWVKGSPDVVLGRCSTYRDGEAVSPLADADREAIEADVDEMARGALRVLGLAKRSLRPDEDPDDVREDDLEWLGLAGMNDPPRPEVAPAIVACRNARIRVVMVTGDHALTAQAIARELGMWDEGDLAVTGAELREMPVAHLDGLLPQIRIFARVTAEQKMDIVQAYQRRGDVVAVTGDGVNDAPALKQADVGVAMGLAGTDVAREAADMVLADDNFATIVAAIAEGRAIFRNIQKFIFFLCSSNAGLCAIVFAASLLRWPAALTPLMILWINLVTNGLPALALGVDPPESGQMREGPRSRSEGLLGGRLLAGTVAVGVVMGLAGLYVFHLARAGVLPGGLPAGQLAAFMVLGLSPLFHAFNCRSFRSSIFSVGLLRNRVLLVAVTISGLVQLSTVLVPPLRPVFRTTADLGLEGWLWVLVMCAALVPIVEVYKLVARAATLRTRRA